MPLFEILKVIDPKEKLPLKWLSGLKKNSIQIHIEGTSPHRDFEKPAQYSCKQASAKALQRCRAETSCEKQKTTLFFWKCLPNSPDA